MLIYQRWDYPEYLQNLICVTFKKFIKIAAKISQIFGILFFVNYLSLNLYIDLVYQLPFVWFVFDNNLDIKENY